MCPNAPKLCTLIYRICARLVAKFCALLITDYSILPQKFSNMFEKVFGGIELSYNVFF